jgi:hypothetical protein
MYFPTHSSVRGRNGFSKLGISSRINLTTWTIMNTYILYRVKPVHVTFNIPQRVCE